MGPEPAFQADAYAPDGSARWGVLVIGYCPQVTDGASQSRVGGLLANRWSAADQADRLVRIELTQVTGSRFGDVENRLAASSLSL